MASNPIIIKKSLLILAIIAFANSAVIGQVTIRPGIDFHFFEDNLTLKESNAQWRPNLNIGYNVNKVSVNFRYSAYAIVTARYPAWNLEKYELSKYIDIGYRLGKSKIGIGYYNRFLSDVLSHLYIYTSFKESGGYLFYEYPYKNLDLKASLKIPIKYYSSPFGFGHLFQISVCPNTYSTSNRPEHPKVFSWLINMNFNADFGSKLRKSAGISFAPQIGLKYNFNAIPISVFIKKASDIYIRHTFSNGVTVGNDTFQFGSVVNYYAWSNIIGVNFKSPLSYHQGNVDFGFAYYFQKIDIIDKSMFILHGYNSILKSNGIQLSIDFPVSDGTYFHVYKNFPFNMKELRENDVGFFSNIHLGLMWEL